MKTASARMLASALIVSGMIASSSCATRTEYVEVRPECSVPPQPTLPQIDGGELEQGTPTADGGRRLDEGESYVDDDVYWRLERREKRLTDWALELSAIAEEACAQPSGGGR